MTLADTSVWIDHFRRRNHMFAAELEAGAIATHPFVIGELALGSLQKRSAIMNLLRELPSIPVVGDDEVLALVEARALQGSGIGWVDAHLIASALTYGCTLWTLDRRLGDTARQVGIGRR